MPGTQPQREKNVDRAARVRENKRRHRTRHKEYVLNLERTLAKAREQGVQATKEVQRAAQQVAGENAKLRDLLGRIGYTHSFIDAWINTEVQSAVAEKIVDTKHSVQNVEASKATVKEPDAHITTAANDSCSNSSPLQSSIPEPRKCIAKPPVNSCVDKFAPSVNLNATRSPCKILSLLIENPVADISQIPLPPPQSEKALSENSSFGDDNGVECSAAYKILMPYAAADEKLGKIAAALERGCTPSVSGGCKVKVSALWKVLDEECI